MKCTDCGSTDFYCKCAICGATYNEPSVPLPPISETQKYELWIDVYQGNGDHDWQALKAGGVAGVCAKIGFGFDKFRGYSGSQLDSRFREYITGARQAGLKTAGYWWSDPFESWGRQVETCLTATRDMDLDWIAADMELDEGYQNKWNKKKGKYIWEKVTIDNGTMSACNKYLLDNLTAELKIPGVLYTRNQFIGPKVLEWLPNYGLWIASLPFEKVITCNRLEAIAKGFTYCATWQEWLDKYALKPDGAWKPQVPTGFDWKIWQFSFDAVKLPGSSSYLDLNWMRI